MSSTRQKYRTKKVEFRLLWLSVEHFIGNAYLPLFADAQTLNEFITDIDSQSNPLHAVLLETYRRAKCSTLESSINPFIVMDVLGESLFHQKNRYDVDVVLIDLIERIGMHISRKFITDYLEQTNQNTTSHISEKNSGQNSSQSTTGIAVIIDLEHFNKQQK